FQMTAPGYGQLNSAFTEEPDIGYPVGSGNNSYGTGDLNYSLPDHTAITLTVTTFAENNYMGTQVAYYLTYDCTTGATLATVPLVVGRLTKTVEFDPVRESDVIRVTAKSKNPNEAVLIANTYAQAYYDRNMFASRARSRAVREFLDEQMQSKRGSLATAEDALQSYMEAKEVVSLDDEARKLIEQLSQLEALRDAADVSIQAAQKTLVSYQQQLAELGPNVARAIGEANDPYIRLLQDQIARLEVQRDVTVAQNPQAVGQDIYRQKLLEIDVQISALRIKLQDRTKTYLETVVPGTRVSGQASDPAGFLSQVKQKVIELQIELQELQSRKTALIEQISQYE
ncbi:MAG: hypothetical protein IH628_16070, partial [Proteobacteria bacterium]|nr:hypothetical protein [Pseudomonadota bacterium]